MGVLAAKVLLAPAFVMCATLAARRYGARIGGLLGGLPVVAGPILLVFALSHGRSFAAGAAAGTLLGLVSLGAFIVVYARMATSRGWPRSLLAGWCSFLAVSGVLSLADISAWSALALALAALGATLLALPPIDGPARLDTDTMPRWDLPLRGASALVLVLVLTALAGQLGAKLSGLLTPFPVVATVLATFTHIQYGADDVVRIMRGFVVGLVAYALFCFTLAMTLRQLDTAAGFALAVTVALAAQAVTLTLSFRRREPITESL